MQQCHSEKWHTEYCTLKYLQPTVCGLCAASETVKKEIISISSELYVILFASNSSEDLCVHDWCPFILVYMLPDNFL